MEFTRASIFAVFASLWLISPALSYAQNVVEQAEGDCKQLPASSLWPATERNTTALLERSPTETDQDTSTASSFEAWRDLKAGTAVALAVCSGTVVVQRVQRPGKLHLTITTKKELGKGKTLADYIQQFDVGSSPQAHVFIKVPSAYHPETLLEVPDGTDLNISLGTGSAELRRLKGDKTIAIAKGDLLLRGNVEAECDSISASFGDGGIKDQRSGPATRTQSIHAWHTTGTGAHALSVAIGSGHLVFLPDIP